MSKAEKTRQFIVEKTAPLFNTKGYAGTSLSDITEATGLTKGSIYGNFSGKDEVALAVFDYNLQKVQAIIGHEMSKHSSAKKQLLVYVSVYDNFLKTPFPLGGCPILNTATEADDTHPGLKQKAASAVQSWKKQMIGLLEKGVRDKEFKPIENTEEIALTLIAMIEGSIMLAKLTGKTNYHKAVMRSVEKLVNSL